MPRLAATPRSQHVVGLFLAGSVAHQVALLVRREQQAVLKLLTEVASMDSEVAAPPEYCSGAGLKDNAFGAQVPPALDFQGPKVQSSPLGHTVHDTASHSHQSGASDPPASMTLVDPASVTGALLLSKQMEQGLCEPICKKVAVPAIAEIRARLSTLPMDCMLHQVVTVTIPKLQHWQQLVAHSSRHLHLPTGDITICNWLAGGIKDVYLGLTGAVLATAPQALVFFATQEAAKQWLLPRLRGPWADTATQVASATAGAIASAVIKVPGDVIKHRVQAYVYSDTLKATHCILRSQGVRGLYAGFGATLLRDVPELVIQFTVYEYLRKALGFEKRRTDSGTCSCSSVQDGASSGLVRTAAHGSQALSTTHSASAPHPLASDKPSPGLEGRVRSCGCVDHLFLGGTAGAIAAVCTTPLDVIKTQLQCQGARNVGAALHNVLAERGLAGLAAGMGPRILQTTVMSAIFFMCYEIGKVEINKAQLCLLGAIKPLNSDM